MRDSIARNDVVIEKANITITSTQKEVQKTLKISDETRKKIQKAITDKGFIETQYKALVKKQNDKYMAAGEYCPKCSATKIVLKEFGDDVKKLKSDVSRLEKECQAISTQKSAIESEHITLQKAYRNVVYERDIYKKDDKMLREHLAKAKKAITETTNSPNRNLKLLEALNSPARLEHSPIQTKETPPPPIKAEKSPTPPDKTLVEKSSEPPPKKRTNGTSLSREEGEVTPEDETTKSPQIKRESPSLKTNESRKRPLSPMSTKAEKPKQMDYVYVINDRQKPPDKMPKPEPRI
uniref:Uncharacterized protein n=1 Tax=Panagrolaimus superbus TaxID=310955 RepID=A0A914Y3Y5_9BILA